MRLIYLVLILFSTSVIADDLEDHIASSMLANISIATGDYNTASDIYKRSAIVNHDLRDLDKAVLILMVSNQSDEVKDLLLKYFNYPFPYKRYADLYNSNNTRLELISPSYNSRKDLEIDFKLDRYFFYDSVSYANLEDYLYLISSKDMPNNITDYKIEAIYIALKKYPTEYNNILDALTPLIANYEIKNIGQLLSDLSFKYKNNIHIIESYITLYIKRNELYLANKELQKFVKYAYASKEYDLKKLKFTSLINPRAAIYMISSKAYNRPLSAEELNILSSCYIELGDYRRAVEELLKTLSLTPNDGLIDYILASTYLELGLYKEAILYFKLAIYNNYIRSDICIMKLAGIYEYLKDYKTALSYLNIVRGRLLYSAIIKSSWIYFKYIGYNKGIDSLLKLNQSNNSLININLSLMYYESKSYNLSEIYAIKASKSTNKEIRIMVANILTKLNNFKLAAEVYNKTIETYPKYVDPYILLANMYINNGYNLLEAKRLLELAQTYMEKPPYASLGLLYFKMNYYKLANKYMVKALSFTHSRQDIYNLMRLSCRYKDTRRATYLYNYYANPKDLEMNKLFHKCAKNINTEMPGKAKPKHKECI